MKSKLFYYNSGLEVQIGDRVLISRLFREDLDGVIVYLPGISPVNPDLEYEDVKQWAIQLSNGQLIVMVYDPTHRLGQPKKDISLVSRSGVTGIETTDRFH